MADTSPCPICGTPVQRWERYPKLLCVPCGALARDEQGRSMRFRNETPLAAGFIAEVDDSGVWRRVNSGACWVNGRRCIAGEHRFGGIVVQAMHD